MDTAVHYKFKGVHCSVHDVRRFGHIVKRLQRAGLIVQVVYAPEQTAAPTAQERWDALLQELSTTPQ